MADTHVTITGNLTDDPDLRITPNGNPVANFSWPSPPASRTATPGATATPATSASTSGGSSPSTSPSP
jgi:hypothetical protein